MLIPLCEQSASLKMTATLSVGYSGGDQRNTKRPTSAGLMGRLF
jgi:hypothetical protein